MKPIPNFPGYFADKAGNIWSMRPYKRSAHPRTEPIKIHPHPNPNGYLMVNLQRDLKKIRIAVHTLILTTFQGSRPDGLMGCHGPNGKSDNSLANLSWGTPTQNQADRLRDGTASRGETHARSVLTDNDIRKMRQLHSDGMTAKAISDLFPTCHSNVCLIVNRKAWTHIP